MAKDIKPRGEVPEAPPSLAGTATDLETVPQKPSSTSPWSIAFVVAVVALVVVVAILRG